MSALDLVAVEGLPVFPMNDSCVGLIGKGPKSLAADWLCSVGMLNASPTMQQGQDSRIVACSAKDTLG